MRKALQVAFAVVWVLRRVLVFGRGDWGELILSATVHRLGRDSSGSGAAQLFALDVVSFASLAVPVAMLLVVNWVWTARLVLAALKSLRP